LRAAFNAMTARGPDSARVQTNVRRMAATTVIAGLLPSTMNLPLTECALGVPGFIREDVLREAVPL